MNFVKLSSLEADRKLLQNLYYRDVKSGRGDRFHKVGDELYVHVEYLCPHRAELEELYFIALESSSGNEKELAKFLAKKTNKRVNTIYMYLRNFKFKNYEFARRVRDSLCEFIQTHNLFYFRGVA